MTTMKPNIKKNLLQSEFYFIEQKKKNILIQHGVSKALNGILERFTGVMERKLILEHLVQYI